MTTHWYAVGDEPWQPLSAPRGQEEVVLEAVAQAMPGVLVQLAVLGEDDDMIPIASCFVPSAGSRDHAIVYSRPVTMPAGEKRSA